MKPIFGIGFSSLTMVQIVDILSAEPLAADLDSRSVVTANLDHIAHLNKNADFRKAYKNAWVSTIDGAPVMAYARFRGTDVTQRVTGADLVAELLPRLNPDKHRLMFVASSSEVGDRLVRYLLSRGFCQSQVGYIVPSFGFEDSEFDCRMLATQIAERKPTHVFVGVGCPKSEIWTDRNRSILKGCYVLHVGAALEFYVGMKTRAPVWMRSVGLEWAWRVGSEPRRLFRRYFISSWGFLDAVRKDLVSSYRYSV